MLRRRTRTGLFLSATQLDVHCAFAADSLCKFEGGQLMANIAWETTHRVETSATPAFARRYWTTVSNWAASPQNSNCKDRLRPVPAASRAFQISRLSNGFSRKFARQNRLRLPCHRHQPFFPLRRFDDLQDGRTRISQRITLKGETPRFTGRKRHLRSQPTRRHEQDCQSDVRGPQAPDGHRFVAPPQRLSQLAISAAAATPRSTTVIGTSGTTWRPG